MKLVAGGDSFVWGSELLDHMHGGPNGYSKSTFAALLSSGKYVCAAYPGIGNIEISKRIKQAIDTPCKVLVCWTWPSRDAMLDSDDIITDLEDHLQTNKIKYMFTCTDNCIITKKINYSNWFLFPSGLQEYHTTTPRGFYQWAVEEDFKCGFEHHPLEEAHRVAANLMQHKFLQLTA